jgi:hypothetical protein
MNNMQQTDPHQTASHVCEELLKDLAVLEVRARRILAENSLATRDIQWFVESVVTIRSLLEILADQIQSGQVSWLSQPIKDMRSNFFDLEGMVKEKRNNLSTTKHA